MAFKLKEKTKVESTYRSIYIRLDLLKKLEKIAKDNNTSVNNVIISMIEECLNDSEE